jgi:hypothetical protein
MDHNQNKILTLISWCGRRWCDYLVTHIIFQLALLAVALLVLPHILAFAFSIVTIILKVIR